MKIYDELKKDHDNVQRLLKKLHEAETAESRRSLITEIRDALVPHSRAEEAVLYNVIRDLDESQGLIVHSYEEHVMAETLLRGLQVTESVALHWQGGVKKLSEALAHHISNEEDKVFAAAKQVISSEEAEMLGRAFVELKPRLGANLIASQFELISNLMPQRFRKSFVEMMDQKSQERERKRLKTSPQSPLCRSSLG